MSEPEAQAPTAFPDGATTGPTDGQEPEDAGPRHQASCSRPVLELGAQRCLECGCFQIGNQEALRHGGFSDVIFAESEAKRQQRVCELLRERGHLDPENAPPSLRVAATLVASAEVFTEAAWQLAISTTDGKQRRRAIDGWVELGDRLERALGRYADRVQALDEVWQAAKREWIAMNAEERIAYIANGWERRGVDLFAPAFDLVFDRHPEQVAHVIERTRAWRDAEARRVAGVDVPAVEEPEEVAR